MKKLSIEDVDLAGKKVFIRVDFNVPLDGDRVTDITRISAAMPTICYAVEQGARVILASHLGRPKGKTNPDYSLLKIVPSIEILLGKKVLFAKDCVGEVAESAVAKMVDGDVLLLENLRFHAEEEKNDDGFSKKLASLADLYVNDAFGTAHRAHASTEGITKYLSPAVAGFLLRDEIDYFNKALTSPEKPLAVVIGGAKASTKLKVMDHLADMSEIMIIGGAMAFTFIKALGNDIGPNLCEDDQIENVTQVMAKAKQKGVKLYLPVDFALAESISADKISKYVTAKELPDNLFAPDIGPASTELFKLALKPAKTIIWNGPMGVFENEVFSTGTFAIARSIAEQNSLTVVGGGDCVTAVNMAGVANRIDHISTGGGAFLELLEGRELPGLSALTPA